jgi:peroxiredoxin
MNMMRRQRLEVGAQAPVFEMPSLGNRQPINLQDYRGRRVLLSFYRYASCPLCNLRVHELAGWSGPWKAHGLDMLAVFQSPEEKLRQYVGRQAVPFPLIPDPEQRLYALYGVSHSWGGFLKAWALRLPEIGLSVIGQGFLPGSVEGGIHRIPADFLIDRDGSIAMAYYGRDIGDHLPLAQIEGYVLEA